MLARSLFPLVVLVVGLTLQAAALDTLPLFFERNSGQAPPEVKFLARGPGYNLLLTSRGASVVFRADHLRLRLLGASPSAKITGVEELPGRSNYLIGSDSRKWRTNLPMYARVEYRGLYPGIKLVYYGNQRELEYDLVVAPGADPKRIRMAIEGAAGIESDRLGDLVLKTSSGNVRLLKPAVYQQANGARRELAGRYVVDARNPESIVVSFDIARYDRTQPLVIDPVLVYSTYFGGSDWETATGIAVDAAGNTYIAGSTRSLDLPTLTGAQAAFGGGLCLFSPGDRLAKPIPCSDAFVLKLDPAGALVYSTYIGGAGEDTAAGIAVDSSGNAYITGYTKSYNFPLVSAVQTTPGGGICKFYGPALVEYCGDAFVAKLNAAGSALVYSTYLGGNGDDSAAGIAVDSQGAAYVTGTTSSTNFPTVNALQATAGASCTPGGCHVAFVTKFNPAGSALVYSTYLGGAGEDSGSGIAIDGSGNAYIIGSTQSSDFPTANALQPATGGGMCYSYPSVPCSDAFVVKLNSTGSTLVYGTYLGGNGEDRGKSIAVDQAGNAYATGTTASANFPVVGALQSRSAGDTEAFVAKLNPAGSALVYATYLGGSGADSAQSIAVDRSGSVYVAGYTSSTDFPLANAFQAQPGGVFVTKLNSGGSAMAYSTYLGGAGDAGMAVAVDALGNACVAGSTRSSAFPARNAWQKGLNGPSDVFISKLADSGIACAYSISPATASFPPSGGTGSAAVSTADNCGWKAVSNAAWLAISPEGYGTGAGTARYSVATNASLSSRSATLNIGGQTVTISQAAPDGFAGTTVEQLSATAARATVTLSLAGSVKASSLQITLSVTADAGASPLAGTLAFQPSAGTPAPAVDYPAPGSIRLTWQSLDVALSGAVGLGELLLPLPIYIAGQSYTVRVADVSGNSGAGALTLVPGPKNVLTLAQPNPAPLLSWLSPSSVTPGSGAFKLLVNGASFAVGAVVRWNGTDRQTEFISTRQLGAQTQPADVAAAGTAQVTVFNPLPDGGVSQPLPFTISSVPPPAVNPGGTVHAASYTARVAGGSIASVFGVNLASTTAFAKATPLPAELAGVVVRVNGIAAPLFYVSPLQINFQMPWETLDTPKAAISVQSGGVVSATQPIESVAFTPGVFAIDSAGSGQAAAQIAGTAELAAPAGSIPGRAARPVRRGEFLEIYCTGLGPVSNPPGNGVPAGNDRLSVATYETWVTIGGVWAPVSFAGLAPGFVGLYQVNVQVPEGAASGDAVPLVVNVEGAASNTVTIAVQ